MDTRSIKILLKLLGKKNYRAKIGEIKPDNNVSISQTFADCQSLSQKNLLILIKKNIKIKITDQGKKNLKDATAIKSYSQDELKILKSCQEKEIEVSKIKIYPAVKRDEIIITLSEKKSIIISEIKIIEAQLTDSSLDYLAKDLLFIGNGTLTLSKSLVNNYLNFIRNYFIQIVNDNKVNIINNKEQNKPDKKQILKTIIRLDNQINSGNYLPLFYLRNEYKNILTREELDNVLYELENDGKISLSTLTDASKFSHEEYEAGIPQPIGGALFYITIEST